MDKKARSIDGIILRPNGNVRRRAIDMNANHSERLTLDNVTSEDITRDTVILTPTVKRQRTADPSVVKIDETLDGNYLDGDIRNSLYDLNEDSTTDFDNRISKDKRLNKVKKLKNNKPPKKRRKLKIIIISIIVLILAAVGFFAYQIIINGTSIFDGNIVDILKNERLAEDANGRTNVLIFGTAPEDYDGELLADTVIVLSLDQDDKTAYTVSLPRDLYVKHYCPNPVMNTTAGKLNETYKCVYDDDIDNEYEASNEFQKVASEITGLDLQYYVHMSWAGVEAVVDSIGGIDIVIESEDPRGIYDYYTGVKYAKDEAVHLNGVETMALARSRGAGGGYGFDSFGGSNYFREYMQQKIIQAVQAKALSSGSLSNPVVALNILSALGKNLRTNFKTSEVRSLISIASEIKTENIKSIPLRDAENNIALTVSDMINGASVEIPKAGIYDYSEIKKYLAKKLSSDPIITESATIDVFNGSGESGLAQTKAKELELLGYNIDVIDNAPDGKYESIEIYQLNADKTGTAKALKKKYGVEIKTELPPGILGTADFVLIFGAL